MKLLFEIDKNKRNISELAKIMDMAISSTSILISRWALEGVIEKQRPNEEVGKEIIIILTEYGKAQVELLRKLHNNHRKKRESGLTTEDTINGGV